MEKFIAPTTKPELYTKRFFGQRFRDSPSREWPTLSSDSECVFPTLAVIEGVLLLA